MEFPTQYTESVRKGSKQVFSKPSMTEPDNAMSIPEIIARFTRGQGLQVQQYSWQSGSAYEDDGFNPGETDINEFMELRQQHTPEPTPVPAQSAAAGQQQPAQTEPAPSPAPAQAGA